MGKQSTVFCATDVDFSLEMHKGLYWNVIAQSLNKIFELVWKQKAIPVICTWAVGWNEAYLFLACASFPIIIDSVGVWALCLTMIKILTTTLSFSPIPVAILNPFVEVLFIFFNNVF